MNKEDILLKNFSILSKNITENKDALKSSVSQLISISPELGLRCWEEIINNNINELQKSFGTKEYKYGSIGRIIINDFESQILQEASFENAIEAFSKSNIILDIVYTQSPIDKYSDIYKVLSFLIRNERFQEADNILSAIYKNKTFSEYSKLWNNITNEFDYINQSKSKYNPGGIIFTKSDYLQPESVQKFCISWIERIKDEVQKAGAMTHAMRMF